MKRIFALLFVVICLFSCQKAPFLTLNTPSTLTFTEQGGTQDIIFQANRDWSASSSDSWCKVSPASGNAAEGNISFKVSCDPNSTYDTRSCTVTIKVEELTEIITVNQETNLGLLISPTEYNLTNKDQTIEVEVRTNVKYTVDIDSSCRDWIKLISTKALNLNKLIFDISANETYDDRTGRITIRQSDGALAETITVKQGQSYGLFVTIPEYNLSNKAHTLSVEVQANIEFDVQPEVNWIHYVETRGLKTSIITLNVDANSTYDQRIGKVQVKQKNGNLSGTITITQKQLDGLFVSPKEFNLSSDEQTIEVKVNYNVSSSIVIPDDAKEWVSLKRNTSTRGLAETSAIFTIAKNTSYDDRETSITFKQTDGPLAQTLRITQSQTDCLIIGKKDYDVGRDGETIVVQIETNVELDVIIPDDAKEWITRVETPQSRGLTNKSVYLKVAENSSYFGRTASVVIRGEGMDLKEEILIKQAQTDALVITNESLEYEVDFAESMITINFFHNIPFNPESADLPNWITSSWETIDENNVKVILHVMENAEIESRFSTIVYESENKILETTVLVVQDRAPIDLGVEGTANCYIIPSSGWYKFNATVEGNTDLSIEGVNSVELLWETIDNCYILGRIGAIEQVKFKDSFAYIKIRKHHEPENALLAAKDHNGKVLWSWHLWITEYNPTIQYDTYARCGAYMMNRDLGALSNIPGDSLVKGLFYQWGRKDPFIGNETPQYNIVESSPITGTTIFASENPTIFISYAAHNDNDWLYGVHDTGLWGKKKTKYDPCPQGWKVPNILYNGGTLTGVWENFPVGHEIDAIYDEDNRGICFGSYYSNPPTWYPVYGTISGESGLLSPSGTGGYHVGRWWSSFNQGSSAFILEILDSFVSPYVSTGPASGLSVRCQRE